MINMKEKKPQKERESHGVQLLLRAVVRDSEGRVISDTGRKPSRSFVIQFLEYVYWKFSSPAAVQDATDILNAEEEIYGGDLRSATEYFRVKAAVNEDAYGVVIGTGDTAADNEDYKLETKIAEGTGAGQMTHGQSVVEDTGEVGANVDLDIVRIFTNFSGATITVKEAGIYVYSNTHHHCIVRDVLPAAIDVVDKCSLTIYYTFRTAV